MTITVQDETTAETRPQPDPRAEFVASLRELADFIEAHPGIPVPRYAGDIMCSASNLDDVEGAQTVAAAAATFGTPVRISTAGANEGTVHFDAVKQFGRPFAGVSYRVFKIAADRPQPVQPTDDDLIVAAVLTPDAPQLPADPIPQPTTCPTCGYDLGAGYCNHGDTAEPMARTWTTGPIPADVDEVTQAVTPWHAGVWRRSVQGGWRFHTHAGLTGVLETEAYVLSRGEVTEVLPGGAA
jgi:hypothetical protein